MMDIVCRNTFKTAILAFPLLLFCYYNNIVIDYNNIMTIICNLCILLINPLSSFLLSVRNHITF